MLTSTTIKDYFLSFFIFLGPLWNTSSKITQFFFEYHRFHRL